MLTSDDLEAKHKQDTLEKLHAISANMHNILARKNTDSEGEGGDGGKGGGSKGAKKGGGNGGGGGGGSGHHVKHRWQVNGMQGGGDEVHKVHILTL